MKSENQKQLVLTYVTEMSRLEVVTAYRLFEGKDVKVREVFDIYYNEEQVLVECYSFEAIVSVKEFLKRNNIDYVENVNNKYTYVNKRAIVKDMYRFLCKNGRFLEATVLLGFLRIKQGFVFDGCVLWDNDIANYLMSFFKYSDRDYGFIFSLGR